MRQQNQSLIQIFEQGQTFSYSLQELIVKGMEQKCRMKKLSIVAKYMLK